MALQWNVWDDNKVSGFGDGLEQKYDFTDMIAFVAWLNVLVRKSGVVGMACLAQTVNVVSMDGVEGGGEVAEVGWGRSHRFWRVRRGWSGRRCFTRKSGCLCARSTADRTAWLW